MFTSSHSHNKNLFFNKTYLLFLFFSIAVLLGTSFVSPRSHEIKKALIAPPNALKHFTFGYSEVAADSLWIRVIQDFDYCEQKEEGTRNCRNNSWLFQVLNLITDLSPSFYRPYSAGSLALTVIVSDIDGATKIFEKGIKQFPEDWVIPYRAAYHYLYELNDKKRAAELLSHAGHKGAPPWVFTLSGRLFSDSGRLDLAEAVLQEMINSKQDKAFIERLQAKIQSMREESK